MGYTVTLVTWTLILLLTTSRLQVGEGAAGGPAGYKGASMWSAGLEVTFLGVLPGAGDYRALAPLMLSPTSLLAPSQLCSCLCLLVTFIFKETSFA